MRLQTKTLVLLEPCRTFFYFCFVSLEAELVKIALCHFASDQEIWAFHHLCFLARVICPGPPKSIKVGMKYAMGIQPRREKDCLRVEGDQQEGR